MLIPNKHEDLSKNLLVLGGDILKELKKKGHNIEELYITLKFKKDISLDTYYDTLTFLRLSELINYNNETYHIFLKKENAT